MKIRPVREMLFHANRPTDRHDEGYSRLYKFCKRAKKLQRTSK